MRLAQFTKYLVDNNCNLTPMPDWNKANTLLVFNKSNRRTAYLNTRTTDGELFDSTIELICTRLVIPLPPNYST